MSRNAGENMMIDLSKPFRHPTRSDNDWSERGLTVSMEYDLHVVNRTKVENMRSKSIDPQPIPCIIPIIANKTLNSDIWLDLAVRLKNSELLLLIDDIEYDTFAMSSKDWYTNDNETKARHKAPHLTTNFMINEAVNLKQSWSGGDLKLEEPLMGTKDCIVAVAYGNYIASKIINKLEKSDNTDEFDANQWKLVW